MAYAPDPALLASLQNTLTPAGVLTQFQADAARREAELAAQTMAAQQASQGATAAYQGAAAAPVQDVSPLDEGLNALLGNVASVLADDPSFRERAQEDTRTKRKNLLQARLDNLAALRDNHLRMAEAAKQAGDYEREQKDRMKFESLSKTYDLVSRNQDLDAAADRQQAGFSHDREMEGVRNTNELGQIAARGAQDGATNQTRPGALFDPDEVQAAIDDLAEGRTEIQNVPVEKGFRRAVQAGLRAQGKRIMPTRVRTAINEMSAAAAAVDEIEAISLQVNTAKANMLSRGAKGVANVIESLNQSGLAADLESVRGGMAGNLARAIAAERGVLTDQDRKFAMRLVPGLFTSEKKAKRDIARLRRFMRGKIENASKAYTTQGGGAKDPAGLR